MYITFSAVGIRFAFELTGCECACSSHGPQTQLSHKFRVNSLEQHKKQNRNTVSTIKDNAMLSYNTFAQIRSIAFNIISPRMYKKKLSVQSRQGNKVFK